MEYDSTEKCTEVMKVFGTVLLCALMLLGILAVFKGIVLMLRF